METESLSQPESSRRLWIWVLLGLLVVLIAGLTVVVLSLPRWIEPRLRAAMEEMDWERHDLEVSRVTLSRIELRKVNLADPGWSVQADQVEVRYHPLELLARQIEAVIPRGLEVVVDLDEWESRQVAGSRPEEDIDSASVGPGLTVLPRAQVHLEDAVLIVKRGEAAERFVWNGKLESGGDLVLNAEGSGLTPATVSVGGEFRLDRGAGELEVGAKVTALSGLLDGLYPGWAGEGQTIWLGPAEATARIPLGTGSFRTKGLRGKVDMESYRYGEWGLDEVVVTAEQTEGEAIRLVSNGFEAVYGEDVRARGRAEADFTPGATPVDSLIAGRVHVESASVYGLALDPAVLPVEGNLEDLVIRGARITSPELPALTLKDVEVAVEDLGAVDVRAAGQGILTVAVSGWSEPDAVASDDGEDAPLAFPASGEVRMVEGGQEFELRVTAQGPDGAPFVAQSGDWRVRGTGESRFRGKFQRDALQWNANLVSERVDWLRGERLLVSVTDFELENAFADGQVEGRGRGSLNGKPFPLTFHHQVDTGRDPWVVDSDFALGPFELDEATWPGELIDSWRGARVTGRVDLQGEVHAEGGNEPEVTPDFRFRLRGGNLVYPDGETTATGVDGDARLVSLKPLRYAPGMSLSIDRVSTPVDVDLTGIRLNATLEEDRDLRINAFQAGLFGGQVRLDQAFRIPAHRRAFTMSFDFRRIQAAEIIKLFPKFEGEIEASVSGRVPLRVEEGKLTVLEGDLRLDSDRPARLSYDATGFLTEGMNPRQRGYKINQSVERAMGNLSVQQLDVKLFDPSDPTHPARIKLTGTGKDQDLSVPVTLNVPVEDEEGILRSVVARILSGGMNVLLE